jgi:hypothetical protein
VIEVENDSPSPSVIDVRASARASERLAALSEPCPAERGPPIGWDQRGRVR